MYQCGHSLSIAFLQRQYSLGPSTEGSANEQKLSHINISLFL